MTRRPILSKPVIASLDALVAATAATESTEAGLRYLRQLVDHERNPAIMAKRIRQSAMVQLCKDKAANPALKSTARARAIAAGERHYTGRPCSNGHSGRRYTSTRACVDCVKGYGNAE